MYRTYNLTNEEMINKFIISMFDGDTIIHTVFENEEEYKREQEKIKKIDVEYNRQKKYNRI